MRRLRKENKDNLLNKEGQWVSMECTKCQQMTEWYLKQNAHKRGYVLCEDCYEKSKEYICYVNLPYDPKERESFKEE